MLLDGTMDFTIIIIIIGAFHHLCQSAPKPQESGTIFKDILPQQSQYPLLTARSRGSSVQYSDHTTDWTIRWESHALVQREPWFFLAVKRQGA